MAFKGGYKLIDFKETDITVGGAAVTISGVYASIENNYRKPTLITGLSIDGVEKEDCFINFEHGVNVYNGFMGMNANNKILFISVTNQDLVTITEVELS